MIAVKSKSYFRVTVKLILARGKRRLGNVKAAKNLNCSFYQTFFGRVSRRLAAVRQVQFVHYALHVGFYRVLRNKQAVGYFFIGGTFGHELQNFLLARAQNTLWLS